MPSFESAVNPLHQVQGLGPVILKVNHVDITGQILTNIFGLEVFAEYQPFDNADVSCPSIQNWNGWSQVAKDI